jgi:hypothetical protein
MTSTDFSENALVEQPAIALFEELGWPSANCFYEKVGTTNSTLGQESTNGNRKLRVAQLPLLLKLISWQLNIEELNIDLGTVSMGYIAAKGS